MAWPKGVKRKNVTHQQFEEMQKAGVMVSYDPKKETAGNKRNFPASCIPMDERQIVELAKIQCTMKEIAAVMGCSESLLINRYAALIENAKEQGNASLRRSQYLKATEQLDTSMLIWLGKTILKQKEARDDTFTTEQINAMRVLSNFFNGCPFPSALKKAELSEDTKEIDSQGESQEKAEQQ